MENPTLFDNADIPDAAQKMVWDSLQIPISELKLDSNSTVFEAIIRTLAREAIQKKNVRAAEVLLKVVFRTQISNKKDETTLLINEIEPRAHDDSFLNQFKGFFCQ